MKLIHACMALPLVLLLTACPSKEKNFKQFKDNHYDFSDLHKVYHKGLNAFIPAYFIPEYGKGHMIQKEGLSRFDPETSIYFSIEYFSEDEVTDIQFTYEEGTPPVEALHAYYRDLRAASLDHPKISIAQDLPEKMKFKGFYQVIRGSRNSYDYDKLVYQFASLERKVKGEKRYYIVQLIAQEELAKYLSDDFKRMLYGLK